MESFRHFKLFICVVPILSISNLCFSNDSNLSVIKAKCKLVEFDYKDYRDVQGVNKLLKKYEYSKNKGYNYKAPELVLNLDRNVKTLNGKVNLHVDTFHGDKGKFEFNFLSNATLDIYENKPDKSGYKYTRNKLNYYEVDHQGLYCESYEDTKLTLGKMSINLSLKYSNWCSAHSMGSTTRQGKLSCKFKIKPEQWGEVKDTVSSWLELNKGSKPKYNKSSVKRSYGHFK